MKQSDTEPQSADFRQTPVYQAAVTFLNERIDYERITKMPYSGKKLNLQRMLRLLDLLDNPHDQTPLIHIAGTKGKGSTSAFICAAVHAHGRTSGSYTSPHLVHVEERFHVNGQPCAPELLVHLVEQVRPAVTRLDALNAELRPTYFEIVTAMAFLFFVHHQVDLAAVEVGLGGRLDSTNVCTPLVSVITSISLDHTQQLGATTDLIAAEKAGIIKPDIPVVSGVVAPTPRDVIRRVALQRSAPLYERDRDFRYASYRPSPLDSLSQVSMERQVNGEWRNVAQDLSLGCRGEHQAANASVAYQALTLLPDAYRPDQAAIRTGFANAKANARTEVVCREPLVIVDTAHNAASAESLVATLNEFSVQGQRRLVIATTRGKDVLTMLRIWVPYFDTVICTRYQENPRGHSVDALVQMARQTKLETQANAEVLACQHPLEAWRLAQEISRPQDLVCIAGSFFLAAELRNRLLAS